MCPKPAPLAKPSVSLTIHHMRFADELRQARHSAGLTQIEVAIACNIARPNIATYEAGRREPRLCTAQALLDAVGASLQVVASPSWHWTETSRPYAVPSRLWALPASVALGRFEAPTHLWWSGPPRTFNLAERVDRLRAYEVVLREGTPTDISTIVDGMLLREAWPDLVLPAPLRSAWQSLIDCDPETSSEPPVS